MKKIVLLALASLAMGAASAQEVTYVEDCSQGLLMNRAKDNWFITAQGGSNILFGKNDVHADLKNRFGGNAALYVGKWVTPTFGFRLGANWIMSKGACYPGAMYQKMNDGSIDGKFYPEKFMGIGPEFDILVNLTNWWCGYKPNRVYNATLHGGAGAYWTQARRYNHDGGVYLTDGNKDDLMWVNAHNTVMFANVGIMNSFALSKHFELFLDVQYNLIDFQRMNSDLAVSLGFTVNLGKTDWNCPTTAVCPTWKYTDAEGDALVARLANADNKIADLQKQLDDCLKRPVKQAPAENCEGLCTVYYPINQSTISPREKNVLRSVANVMKESNKKYILTGWADNYTGNDEINTRLRNARVNGVKAFLIKCGVNEDQLDARIDNNNLTDFGIKSAPLDRAVTIKEAK